MNVCLHVLSHKLSRLTAQEAAGSVVRMAESFCQPWEGTLMPAATPVASGNQLELREDLGASLESLEWLLSTQGFPEGLREFINLIPIGYLCQT